MLSKHHSMWNTLNDGALVVFLSTLYSWLFFGAVYMFIVKVAKKAKILWS